MIRRYASDVVNHAMRLAQQQAINQFSFRDTLYLLNQHWRYCYERIVQIDPGFYSITKELTQELTKLPPYVFGSIYVYSAQDPFGKNRQMYTHSGVKDMVSPMTFNISGQDLYCWDVKYHKVFLNFVPAPKDLFFPVYSRNPTIIPEDERPKGYDNDKTLKENKPKFWRYGMYELVIRNWDEIKDWMFQDKHKKYQALTGIPSSIGGTIHTKYEDDPDAYYDPDEDFEKRFKDKRFYLRHMGNPTHLEYDITEALYRGAVDDATFDHEMYNIVALFCDFPYMFVSYQHRATGEYHSVILKDILSVVSRNKYNPFDFNGRDTKVKFLDAKHNDDTGMGVIIEDYDDMYEYTDPEGEVSWLPKIKELGWTPDTLVTYPADCIFDYIVGHMAKRFANKNESTIMDIDHHIGLAEKELSLFLKKDTNPWVRIVNAVGPRISDLL